MTIGVYEIIAPDGRRYIGSSGRSVENRLSFHKSQLRRGEHYNSFLQAAHDEVGWEALRVRVTPVEDSLRAEQIKLNYWRSRGKLLNIHPSANSARGRAWTEEAKANAAAAAKERCTPEWRAAVSYRVKKQHEEGRFAYDKETATRRVKWDTNKPHGLKGRKQTEEHKKASQEAINRNAAARYRALSKEN